MIAIVVADIIIGAAALWLAAKITHVNLHLTETLIAATLGALVALIPTVGPFLAVVALLVVLKYYSSADLWPDLILVCVVSRVIAAVVAGLLVGLVV